MHRSAGDTGLPQRAHGLGRNQRRLFGRFGQHRVAGGQCCSHLAHEDGQRKVPGADAGHGAQRDVGGVAKIVLHLGAVVAQEVHRFAYFGNGVGARFAGLAHQQSQQRRRLLLQQICRACQGGCALRGRRGGPLRCGLVGPGQGVINIAFGGFVHMAHHVAVVGRVEHRHGKGGRYLLRQQGACLPGLPGTVLQCGGQAGEFVFAGQVQSPGIGALGAIELQR